jgi:hypothetical protein
VLPLALAGTAAGLVLAALPALRLPEAAGGGSGRELS